MKHGADAVIVGRKCVFTCARARFSELISCRIGLTAFKRLPRSSRAQRGACVSPLKRTCAIPPSSAQRSRRPLSVSKGSSSSFVVREACHTRVSWRLSGYLDGFVLNVTKKLVVFPTAAAGNFLAPISTLSENGFKTVIDIDVVRRLLLSCHTRAKLCALACSLERTTLLKRHFHTSDKREAPTFMLARHSTIAVRGWAYLGPPWRIF
jgi:hypothetical protein